MCLGRKDKTKEEMICLTSQFRYLNDLYILECKGNSHTWDQPTIRGAQPIERESHSCVSYRGRSENRSKLIVYGGMNGHRLGDIWNFYLGKNDFVYEEYSHAFILLANQ